jgi:hypothetical protein
MTERRALLLFGVVVLGVAVVAWLVCAGYALGCLMTGPAWLQCPGVACYGTISGAWLL